MKKKTIRDEGNKVNTRKRLLLAVSFFAIMIVIYQLFFVLPDLIDAWNMMQEYRSYWYAGDYIYAFVKILLGLILQIGFFGSVAFWSFYEATTELVGSPFNRKTEEKDDMNGYMPAQELLPREGLGKVITKEGLRKIQLALLAIVGVISLKLIFDALSATSGSHQFINNLISSVFIMVVLVVLILILNIKLRDHKPQRTFQKEEKDDMDAYMENWRKGNQLKEKSYRELYEEKKKRELEDRI
jgi:uncharacterized membrane protein